MDATQGLEARAYDLDPQVLEATQTPFLAVHLDRVRANVARMLELTGGPDRWRPHLKTTKTPQVWAELVAAGLRCFKCATTREARVLAELLEAEDVEGDLCLAYPLRGPGLEVLGRLARRHRGLTLSVLCEDPDLVPRIPPEVSIFVDVNSGMHRTGIPIDDTGAVLAVARAAGERLRGLHGYDGHQYAPDLEVRRRAIFEGHGRLLELRSALLASGLAVGELITSGTPAFRGALEYPGFERLEGTVHRVSPGTVVYHDGRSAEENPGLGLEPAAVVMSRVVSHPAPGLATCDAGSKSIAAEAGDPCARVVGRPDLEALTPSEEHLPLRASGDRPRPERGEVLALVPRHVCPTVNLAEEALLVDGGVTRPVAVAARAHDL